ncbi:MAG: hemolysin III family protein [Methylobacter sp.]|uniref:PAQR family membrane homeostasis protein TrhA n=1 Tax=Methylobacter sp. TaxID=2051955 RepID=UPI0025886298|nr:hemolysin III family protein [Methylobacter sp.]MCL7419835.1 hemolysin III family protein [Methylobacter sp.]
MHDGERFNVISHLLGALAACVGLIVLVVLAVRQGDMWKIVSFSVYGTSLVLAYTFSTLYHGLQGKAREVFAELDHHAIYLLIAGTYTPFTLVTLHGSWGWSIFGIVWSLAVLGSLLELLSRKEQRVLPVVIYLLMGWIILIAIRPLLRVMPMEGFFWLLSGGLFYSIGVVFYALDDRVRYFHNIWHIFVLAGSASHYIAVLLFVV